MIARDEAPALRRCLESVAPFVDEIVVVDTGSSDDTVATAESFGARVVVHRWEEDFAKARNSGLARATGDWILQLDCDEVMARRDLQGLKRRLQDTSVAGILLTTRNYTFDGNRVGWTPCRGDYAEEGDYPGWFPTSKVRLFRRDARIGYVGAVHELVEPSIRAIGGAIAAWDLPVHHYGYVEKAHTASGERYLHLAQKKVKAQPFDAKAWYELALCYRDAARWEDAVQAFERVLDLLTLLPREALKELHLREELIYNDYGVVLLQRRDVAAAREAFEKALAIDAHSPAILNNAALALEALGDTARAKALYEAASSISPSNEVIRRNLERVAQPPSLSVCMIVRDEEARLGRCLDSLRGLADEIVVVDTGSTDRTVALAKAHGAKVHHFAWCDDFSAARNVSLQHATGQWILWLDADDVIPPEERVRIRTLLKAPRDQAYYLVLENQGPEKSRCLQLRLFPNLPGVHFEKPVHEQVVYSLAALGVKSLVTDVRIIHTGYASPEVVAAKKERYLKLMARWLETHPQDQFLRAQVALTYHTTDRHTNAVEEYEKIVADAGCRETNPLLYLQALVFLGRSYLALGQLTESLRCLEQACEIDAHFPLVQLSLGECYTRLHRPERALHHLHAAAQDEGQVSFVPIDAQMARYARHFFSAKNWEALGRCQEAEREYRQAHRIKSDHPAALRNLGELLLTEGRYQEAIPIFESLILSAPNEADYFRRLGDCYAGLRVVEAAKMCYEKTLALKRSEIHP